MIFRKYILIFLPVMVCFSNCKGQVSDVADYASQRKELVERYIIGQRITDKKVVAAMMKVERHRFVPAEIRHMAYLDQPLPVGEGQTISQPSLVAYMTELLDLKQSEKVLEIGTGSGYQAAILGEIVDSVFTIEIIGVLGRKADKLLKELGYNNIYVKIGDGYQGWPEHAPFNAIIVTCAPEKIPEPLKEQLTEGGRMVIPVGPEHSILELVLLRKSKGIIRQEAIIPVRFVPMLKEDGGKY